MGFREGAYATVWEFRKDDRSTTIRISTSRKDKQTDEYITDFSGFVRLIGSAKEKSGQIEKAVVGKGEHYRIRLGACDVTNRYDKESGITYTNYALFDFEPADGSASNPEPEKTEKPAKKKPAKRAPVLDDDDDEEDDEDDDDVPF